ncbi:MAG TPA: ROK family protein [Sporichthya sp.]|nr:ROK family protein [Sporichthya sp.]
MRVAPAVGVDLGGTKIAAGVVDEAGAVLHTARRDTPDGAEAVVDAIAGVIEELGAEARDLPVGIGAAGFVDAARERVLFAPNLGWVDVALTAAVAARVHGPVVLENDANAAAWAEARFGAGTGASAMVLVTVGTGIGGGIVLDGALFRGGFGVAGEFGHLALVADGRPCGCGQSGCWEQYASGGALSRAAREQLGIADVKAAIRAGDPAALGLLAEIGTWLGAGLAAVAAVLDPEVVVVGGGVVENGDLLLEPARAEFRRRLPAAQHRPVAEIRAARLGPAAGMVGAADLARAGAR